MIYVVKHCQELMNGTTGNVGQRMRKIKYILAVLFAIVFLMSGCAQKKAGGKRTIKIGLTVWAGSAHAYIAKEKGFFKKNNVDVELVLARNDPEMLESFRNGKLDGILAVVTDVVMINSEGFPAGMVYITDYSGAGDAIVGKPHFKSLRDLKGKKISFQALNSFSHVFVLRALEKSGLKESELFFHDVHGEEVLDALEQGTIDAGHIWEPALSLALKKGYRELMNAGNIPGIITDVLAFNKRLIDERPDDIEQIVNALLEAREFILSNREEALTIMSKAEGMTKDEMAKGIEGVHLLDLSENVQAMRRSEESSSLYVSTKSVADFFLKRGQLSQTINYDEIISPKFIMRLDAKTRR
jgi:NitT/TauT family transport system substrate-binding protein